MVATAGAASRRKRKGHVINSWKMHVNDDHANSACAFNATAGVAGRRRKRREEARARRRAKRRWTTEDPSHHQVRLFDALVHVWMYASDAVLV